MTKRSDCEGTIFRRPNGSYTARVTLDGRRVSKTFKLRRDAQEWIETIRQQSKQVLTYDSSKTTVSELLNEWLKIKTTQLQPVFKSAKNQHCTRLHPKINESY